MIVYPNAKINVGLHILRKREDGFHAIESVFLPVPMHDILETVEDGYIAFRLHHLF
jgi:4-diphosphocytidyl-2-C-methyl-D-erythritol kinase